MRNKKNYKENSINHIYVYNEITKRFSILDKLLMKDMKRMNSIKNTSIELPKKVKNRIEEIHLDNTNGSVKLAIDAAETLIILMENVDVSSSSQLIACLEMTAKELVTAQPTMAPIFNLVNKILLNICDMTDEEKIRQTVRVLCQNFIKKLDTAGQIISKLAVDIITDNSTILVHSYSATILNTLLLAKRSGKNFDIICTESRPVNEGVHLAERLGKEGIKVTLVVDSAAFSLFPETQLILVGADALSTYGLVNKIGTLGLALAAKKFKVDFHALCDTEKILPAKYTINLKEQKNPKEILSKTVYNVVPINYYFDLTPLEYLTDIITERGIMTPKDIEQYIKNLNIHKTFSD